MTHQSKTLAQIIEEMTDDLSLLNEAERFVYAGHILDLRNCVREVQTLAGADIIAVEAYGL